ncbi:probable E3 SUMO-protein ligase RNF212 [Sitophilus oryzae]|uniref:Probable E3 SUMO-protein ligase RNF212 n=1 Tax=Sitophilus oryzae TaxID=7048 RepID=A0A6J2XPK0_SITOR|nr:probable E3 SUMO-protein ligase RNF212 [Sitophilus oryzae]
MKDWVFCNKCSAKYQSNFKFHLTECGHVFCDRCALKIKETKKCLLCNNSSSTMELSQEMDHSMQMFFWPLENIVQQSLQVINFQKMHKNLYLQFLYKKYDYAKRQCISSHNSIQKLKKENQELREMLKKAGFKTNPFLTSTPALGPNQTADNDLSVMSSIKFGTPGSIPGSARRILQSEKAMQNYLGLSKNSSLGTPSPAQMVPKGYHVPVHQSPAGVTPSFMARIRGKSANLPIYPRK